MNLINLSLAIYYIIILWTILYISLVFHELGHYFFRYIFKIKTNKVRIGSGWRIFRIGVIEFNILPTVEKMNLIHTIMIQVN
jgi:small neutral amino acid transporter SnatA (MarC family)